MIIKSQDVNHITNFDYVKTINVEEVPTADGAVYYISALMKTDSKVEPKRITMACYGQEEAEIEMRRLYQAFKDNAAFFEFRPAFSVRKAESKIFQLVRDIVANPNMLAKIINDYGEPKDDGDADA